MAADPSAALKRLAEARARLREWSSGDLHFVQSARSTEPTYRNPGELRRDLREVLNHLDDLDIVAGRSDA